MVEDRQNDGPETASERSMAESASKTTIFSGIPAFLTAVLAFTAVISACVSYLQWQALRDQVTLANPPKLRIGGADFGERGKFVPREMMLNESSYLNKPDNSIQHLSPGMYIDGQIGVINHGRDYAEIT